MSSGLCCTFINFVDETYEQLEGYYLCHMYSLRTLCPDKAEPVALRKVYLYTRVLLAYAEKPKKKTKILKIDSSR
jgi:hypothetical protein